VNPQYVGETTKGVISQATDWRHLAELASNEMNPAKLTPLVVELNRVLVEREQMFHQKRH
jgi:hypothetical protein